MQHVKRVLIASKRSIKQFHFFQLAFNNVKNIVLSNDSEHLRIVIQWHLNSFFFKKVTKNRPTAGGPAPRLPSVMRLSYTSFLNTFPKLDTCTF